MMQPGTADYHLAITDRKPIYLFTRILLFWIISSSVLQAHGYYMYDSKAVLDDCRNYWTFQDRERIPQLFQMTVCVDVRVVSPGRWLAFSYSSPRTPHYDLALEGDPNSLYAWLLGVRHRFPVRLEPRLWHRLCLRRDSLRNTFSLEVDGNAGKHQRTVIARVIPPHGELVLGCRPRDATPGAARGKVELYLFRMWEDVGEHQTCEDGSVVGWESRLWGVTHTRARVRDELLHCVPDTGAREFGSTPGKTRRKRHHKDTHRNSSNSESNSESKKRDKRNAPGQLFSTLASMFSSMMAQSHETVIPATTSYKSITTPPPLTTPTGTTPPPLATPTGTTPPPLTTPTGTTPPPLTTPTGTTPLPLTTPTGTTPPPLTTPTGTTPPPLTTPTGTTPPPLTTPTRTTPPPLTTPTGNTPPPLTTPTGTTPPPLTTPTGTTPPPLTTPTRTTPPPLTTPTGTTPPPQTTPVTRIISTASTVAPTSESASAKTMRASTTRKETQHPPVGSGSSPSSFTVSSQQTGTEEAKSTSAHPSPHPTSSASPTMTFDPENATTVASITSVVVATDPTLTAAVGAQDSSVSSNPPTMATTETNQITGTTSMTTIQATASSYSPTNSTTAPSNRTLLSSNSTAAQWSTNSTTAPSNRTLLTSNSTAAQWSASDMSQIALQCNFSQFCSNTTSHYWMLVSVNVSGETKTEADIKVWLDNSITHDESTEVSCTDKTNITRTNCTVLLRLSQPMSTCVLRHQLQGRGDGGDIHVTILGDVERVGKGRCVDEHLLPSGGGFVRCTYLEHLDGMCISEQTLNVTCSYMDSEYVPNTSTDPEPDPCTLEDQCDCEAFCNDGSSDSDAYYYALRLNITSPTIKLTDIQDMIFKNSSDCDYDTEQAVCDNITQAFSHFREIHLECHGTETRLHSCMVALMLDEQLCVCVVSRVMAYRLHRSEGVFYDGLLTRMAICGRPSSSGVRLLDSNLTWFSSPFSASGFCGAINSSPLRCKKDETKAVLLSESCQEPPWSRNYSNPVQSQPTTNPTDFSTSSVPITTGTPHTPTQRITSPASLNISHNNITAVWQNTTQFNTTTELPRTSHNTTSAQNITEFNTTALQQNHTQFYTTMLPLNSTQFNTTDVPQDIIQFTTSTQNSTLFNSTTVWWNETLFNTTTPPLKTINSTTTTTWNSTEFNTTPLQLNTTQMYTTINESLQNVTHINTTAFPATAKQSDTTGIPKNSSDFTTAVVSPTSSPNITDTTPLQLNTTQMYTTINESLQNVTHINTNAWPANATQSATTHTPLNSSDFTTAVVSPTSSPNITTSSPQLNTTELFTAPSSYLNTTWDYNATAFPLTTASASQNTSSLPVEVNTTNTGTNGSLTSNYTTGHVLNQTVAPATTSEQKLTSQYNNTVVPDRTATLTTTTTTTTTQSTARPPDPVEPSLTTIATIPTETTTTTMTTTSSPGEQADQLLDQTKDVSALNSSQVADVVNQLEKLLSSPNVSLEVGRAMVSVISNLLNASASSLGSSSKRLIKAVDTLALKLIVEQGNQTIVADSLVLSVTEIDGNIFNGGSFSVAINPNQQRSQASIRRRRRSERESALAEGDLAMITLPFTLTENLSPQQLKEVSRVQFNFYSKTTLFQDGSLDQRRLNSRVLSGSMSNLSISNLTEGVEIILKNDNPIPENGTAVCVFWDLGKNGGAGGWSSEGCFVKNTTTASETICSCNHLTSFAVLLDVSREGITDRQQATVLSFITYIGCGISAIFLSITLLTYISFEKIRRDIPSKILIQLCLALLMLNLVFLLDSWLALYPDAVGLCISTAFFLHYFLLASFTWMALEALHMYLAIVKVFNSYVSRYMLKFSLMGWGIPLPVVIIVISVDTNNYGLITYGKYTDGTTDDFCWLKNDIAFYVGVVAYFCLVFVLNLAMFMVVMVQLKRIKRQNPHNNQHRSSLHDLRSVAGLTFLLGLTWSFAFFAWGPVKLAFMYLFAIFNSLQGFFIFVFHCALKDNVRRQWRMYLCCGRLRLAENSDWSNTATKTTTKKTSLATTSSVHSSISALTHRASRDSFVTGDVLEHSNGIRSPLEDSVITALEDSHGDVVLNEISHRHSSTRLQ